MQNIKHEWKKNEKQVYLPKTQPELVTIPPYKFFTISGQGNPNDEPFAEAIGVLYSLAYGVKMSPKKGNTPAGYFEYSVYPLEGIWDLSDEAKGKDTFSKDELVYRIMIRQPDFVTDDFALQVIEQTKKKKPHPLLNSVEFETIEDGLCIQMMHLGSYDDEPQSFEKMKAFCADNNLTRHDLRHREIYITDARKTPPEKLKTVLRYFVK